MSHIAILPDKGNHISIGYLRGESSLASKDVQNQLDDKGFGTSSPSVGSGAALTFGKDIVSIDMKKGWEIRAGAEATGSFNRVQKDVKTGEKDVWRVGVQEHYWRYDERTENYYPAVDYRTYTFNNPQDAANYANHVNQYNYDSYGNHHNTGTGYYGGSQTYATAPVQGKQDIIDRSSKSEYSLKLGAVVGIQKNFEESFVSNIRVDALTGYDVLQNKAYAGGRVSLSTNYLPVISEKASTGIYLQVDTDISGREKDTRGQIGLRVGF